jgi:hypothetical protein
MELQKDYILLYLQELEKANGGYFGTDINNLAKELGITYRDLQKRLNEWLKSDPAFVNFHYLGKHRHTITRNEFLEMKERIYSNPLEVKNHIRSDLSEKRDEIGKKPIAKTTFYREIKQIKLSDKSYQWFELEGIKTPQNYSVEDARGSLSGIFTFTGLKVYGGADVRAIYERLVKAKENYSKYGIEPIQHYPRILMLGRHLKSLLSSIPPDQQKDTQARLIFEIQTAFVVECTDLLIDELIHLRGRVQQSMNASRQKVENDFRRDSLESIRAELKHMAITSSPDLKRMFTLSDPSIKEDIKARMELLRRHRASYVLFLEIINNLTNGMRGYVTVHAKDGMNFFQLANGEVSWKTLGENEKKRLTRNPSLQWAIENENEDTPKLLAIDRLIEYIRHGKITFPGSYWYQDLGARIKDVICDDKEFLTHDVFERLIAGNYEVNIMPLYEALCSTDIEDDNYLPSSWVNFSDVLKEVSKYVRDANTRWFDEHNLLFRKQTEGMFSMEYIEEEFAERLYDSIGFLGRNFRYRDSEHFWNLRYFVQRYITEATLRLELKFIQRSIETITGKRVEAVIIDTMGIEGRKKSILATYHGRYHTIGQADLRAVSTDMLPLRSGGCRSTDSEAMNIVEIMKDVQETCGGSVRLYSGDSHTVSRVAAGMAFLCFGVIAAGRIHYKPKVPLSEHRVANLKANISLLNKVGKLLRDEPPLGRIMAMRKHVYVDGVNIRKLLEDLGYLILSNMGRIEIPLEDVGQTVEKSNFLKTKARIVERGITRVDKHDTGLLLISGELILSIVYLYHLLKGQTDMVSPLNFSDIRLIIPA